MKFVFFSPEKICPPNRRAIEMCAACSETFWKKYVCYHENWTVGVLYLYHSHTDKVIVNCVCVRTCMCMGSSVCIME